MNTFRAILIIIMIFLVSPVDAQVIDTGKHIGNFSEASSISVNAAGIIFVSDVTNNEIYKLDTLGNLIKSIGGYGWDEYSFDEPIDIFATTLNVYVSDKNNNRIQIYDKDLNFLFDFNKNQNEDIEYSFGYPTCSAVSNQGDIFILDSDNERILKYNLRGELLQEIGSYESGDYMLSSPLCFTISPDNRIFVIDGSTLVIYDQFGMGLNKIEFDFEPVNLNITFNELVLTGESQILYLNFSDNSYLPDTILKADHLKEEIVDAVIFKDKLYLLENNKIRVLKFLQQ